MSLQLPMALIVLLLGQDATAASQQQPASDGERLLRGRCGACHGIDPGQKRPAPHLGGVFGRQAGTLEGTPYSEALTASGIVWDERSLDAFMAGPTELVPGTSMKLVLRDPAQRRAIVEFLRDREGAAGTP